MKPGLGSYDAEPLPAAHSPRERFPTPEIRSSKAKGATKREKLWEIHWKAGWMMVEVMLEMGLWIRMNRIMDEHPFTRIFWVRTLGVYRLLTHQHEASFPCLGSFPFPPNGFTRIAQRSTNFSHCNVVNSITSNLQVSNICVSFYIIRNIGVCLQWLQWSTTFEKGYFHTLIVHCITLQ